MNQIVKPDESDSARCPHFDEVDEETLRRLFSKVAAVRSEDYDLFQFTHRPMEVFRGTAAEVKRGARIASIKNSLIIGSGISPSSSKEKSVPVNRNSVRTSLTGSDSMVVRCFTSTKTTI